RRRNSASARTGSCSRGRRCGSSRSLGIHAREASPNASTAGSISVGRPAVTRRARSSVRGASPSGRVSGCGHGRHAGSRGLVPATAVNRILERVLLVAGGLLVGVALMEVGLRIGAVTYPRTTEAGPELGVLHRPGIRYRYRDEGEAFIEINEEGFRDQERAIAKPPDAVRI